MHTRRRDALAPCQNRTANVRTVACPRIRNRARAVARAVTMVAALVFAGIGVLILMLMPTVRRVLAMNAFARSREAGRVRGETVRESLAYGLGATLSQCGLGALRIALRAGGDSVGWGFHLRE